MPNKKKKEPKNPYYFFMLKFRKDEESKGRRFGGMAEVATAAGNKWREMNAAQRAPFEELARKAKLQDKNDLENKYTSQGVSYAQLQREEEERREKERKIIQDIQQHVGMLDVASGTLLWHPFYFAHVNYYCQRDGNYYPCEIAIARFTLRKGIDDTLHSLIELDELPRGYRYEATRKAQETHEIPLPPNECGGERDYYRLSRKIHAFLMEGRDDNTLPPLYTLPVHIDPVANVLGFLDNSVDDDGRGSKAFRVYPLVKLFFELRNACARHKHNQNEGVGFPVEALAERELDKDMFNFTAGISCAFHETKDSVQYCSLSIVKRWCFLIADHCCQDVDVPLIPGSHVPIFSDTSKSMIKPEIPRAAAAAAVQNGAIPKQPMPITLIDHSKASQSDKDVRHYNVSGAGDVPIRSKAPAPPPLRQPNTMPQAIAGVLRKKEPIFTPEDFPAIGDGGIFGKIPMAVAGRGRGIPLEIKENKVPGAGRGRGLVDSLASLNIIGD
ncbi:protein maelstrom homolog [Anabrus simplex]|uniref:protein maelstrom homolog n=1 Tax=Anabrus simplex TaxID=316456 RepID=UPI0035A3276D